MFLSSGEVGGGGGFVSLLFGCFCFSSSCELGNQKETDRKSTAETCGFGVGFLWFICDLQPAPASCEKLLDLSSCNLPHS